jgi:hypothetical protein
MLVKSALTLMPVLGVALAGNTLTVRRVMLAGRIESGVARPLAESCAGSPPHR